MASSSNHAERRPPAEYRARFVATLVESRVPSASSHTSKDIKKFGDKMRPAIKKGYFVHLPDSPTPSQNTRVLFGTSLTYSDDAATKVIAGAADLALQKLFEDFGKR